MDSLACPYQMHLLHLGKEKESKDAAEKLYKELCDKGIGVLYGRS